MSNVNALLSQRLKKGEQSSKMAAMAKQSANGSLTSFAGIFSVTELSSNEKSSLEDILKEYLLEEESLDHDLHSLISITSEVKAINNQAAMLHGERIKKAQSILLRYRDGAFTAWLIKVYGNRQTPYNFLQYYEFHEMLPKPLRPQIEAMPRQAIYTLASREGPFEIKQKIIEDYKGETKAELLLKIREIFPLPEKDKRAQNLGESIILGLNKIVHSLENDRARLSKAHKKNIYSLLEYLRELSENCKDLK